LFTSIGNLPVTALMKLLSRIKNCLDWHSKNSLIIWIFKAVFDLIFYIVSFILSIGNLVLMRTSQRNEYIADEFALECGYGEEVARVLTEIYQMIISNPQSIKEIINSTHPPITCRIENLEYIIYEDK